MTSKINALFIFFHYFSKVIHLQINLFIAFVLKVSSFHNFYEKLLESKKYLKITRCCLFK